MRPPFPSGSGSFRPGMRHYGIRTRLAALHPSPFEGKKRLRESRAGTTACPGPLRTRAVTHVWEKQNGRH